MGVAAVVVAMAAVEGVMGLVGGVTVVGVAMSVAVGLWVGLGMGVEAVKAKSAMVGRWRAATWTVRGVKNACETKKAVFF